MSDDEIERELQQLLRIMMTSGGQFAEMLARNRERRVRAQMERVQAETAAAEREGRARQQQWRDEQRRIWEQASWGDWQENATLGEWAGAYTAARTARDQGLDANAAQATDMIRGEVQRRFGVDLAREYGRLHHDAEAVGEAAREYAGVQEQNAQQHFAEADQQPRDTGPEMPDGRVLTEEEFARRYRPYYVGTFGDWVDNATPEQFVEAYATAREMEDVDSLAAMAARGMEDRYAALHPERFPEGGQQFRWTWDRVQENLDRGAQPGQRGPSHDAKRLDEQRAGHQALGQADTARGWAKDADTQAAQAASSELSVYRDPTQATTLNAGTTGTERSEATHIVHTAGPGFARMDPTTKDSTRARSSKPRSRAPQQARDQKRNKGKGM
ncbi:hypothetical protein [Enemella dayhoffiae]|uniref:hypothetical protein n=1 Tax=Enemella dayhoffiae TaxID=2016507 RepID=UPI001594E851|nr:hypothetical protein [Enemella dayhoffiae]